MSHILHTPLCDLLGCKYPVVQTAMGWVADANMVAGTSNAGGFGFLAGAVMTPAEVEAAIIKTKSLTKHNFGVNFHMFQPGAMEIIDIVLKHRDQVRAVSYGRGPDKKMIQRFKDAGILCMPTVGAVKHAVKAIELGADIVTVQGGEGGGHTGSVPSSILLPQVLDAVQVPVVAAGGYYDGRGLASALACGAAGIAMGTRFLMTKESPVPQTTLQHYVAVKDPAAIRTTTAVDGLPQRFLDNPTLHHLEAASPAKRVLISARNAWQWRAKTGMTIKQMMEFAFKALKDGSSISETIMSANAPVVIQRAMVEGVPDEGLMPSGQVAAMIKQLESCEEVITGIVNQASARLESFSKK
ncbi:MAG: nitronate monooxygenase, partial [Sterolibacterium sp.]|nr:nitronate monooxygenase [Sterolibacterium sp.]